MVWASYCTVRASVSSSVNRGHDNSAYLAQLVRLLTQNAMNWMAWKE